MDLEQVFSQNPLLGTLKKEEHNAVFDIFASTPMKVGGLDLVYDRTPDFDALLDCQSSHYYTFVVRRDERVRALGSVSWGRRWVKIARDKEPQLVNVSYAGDFRALFEKETARAWRQFYSDLMEAVYTSPEFGPSQFLLTVVLRDNEVAMRNIVRHGRKQIRFTYDLLREIEMVNFFFPKPWKANKTTDDYMVRAPMPSEEFSWRQWLATQHKKMNFGYDYSDGSENEWDRRRTIWSGWDFQKFLAVYNKDEKLILMTMPWAPTEAKRMQVTQGSLGARCLYQGFRLLGFNSPRVGEVFKTLYLSHLTFASDSTLEEKRQALLNLVEHLNKQGLFKIYNMISFPDQWGLVADSRFDRFYMQKTGVNLYAVRRPEDPEVQLPANDFDFEMAIV